MTKLKKGFEDFQSWVFMRTHFHFPAILFAEIIGYLWRWSFRCQWGGKQGPSAPAGGCWPCLKRWLERLCLMGCLPAQRQWHCLCRFAVGRLSPMDWSNPFSIKSPRLAVSVGEGWVRQHRNLLRNLWVSLTSPSNVSPAVTWLSLAVGLSGSSAAFAFGKMLPQSRNWPWIWAPWLLSGIKSFTDPCHSIFTAAHWLWLPQLTLFPGPFALHQSLIPYVQKVCISEVKWAFFFFPFFFGALLSMAACLRTPMKHWACQAACHISNTMCPCLSQSWAVLSLGLKHVFARHRGVAYHCRAGASVPGSAHVVLDGENGWIAKWRHGRKPHDLCTCFRLEGSMGQEPAFESACLELGWA